MDQQTEQVMQPKVTQLTDEVYKGTWRENLYRVAFKNSWTYYKTYEEVKEKYPKHTFIENKGVTLE